MIQWTDHSFETSGFGVEPVRLLRDIPKLGIVLTVSEGGSMPLRLSTWDRASQQRIRERRGSRDADQYGRSGWPALSDLPSINPQGDLIFFSCEQGDGEGLGSLNGLGFDSLESECLLPGLSSLSHMKKILVSANGQLAWVHNNKQGDWLATLYSLETRAALWQSRDESSGMWSESFNFSPCSRMAIDASESNVQSGSDTVHFSLMAVRSRENIVADKSSVYSESLRISHDGSEVLLQEGREGYIKGRWPIPLAWQRPASGLPPPTLRSWKHLINSASR